MMKEGTLSYAIVYILVFIITVFVFLMGIPFMLSANHAFYQTGTVMMDQGLQYAKQIHNKTVQNTMVNIFTKDKAAFVTGEPILGKFAQYGWLFVIIVITFVVLVLARRAEQMNQNMGLI